MSRSPSTCRGRRSALRSTPNTRPAAPRPPTEFKGQCRLIQEVLDALHIPSPKLAGYEADDIIATLATQALAGPGIGGADLLRRPRLVPAGQRVLHRALPDAWRLRPGADDAGGGRGEVRRPAAPLPRARRAGGGELRQPARRPGRRPEDRREVDQQVRRPRQRHRPRRRDHRQGRREPARPPRRRDPQPPAQRAGLRPGRSRSPPRPRRPAWDREPRCPSCSTSSSSGCCATGSTDVARARGRAGDESGLRRSRAGARRRVRSRAGSPDLGGATRRGARGRGAGVRHRRVDGLGLATAGRAAWVDPTELDAPTTRRRWRAGSRTPSDAEGHARRQGPDAGVRRPRLVAGRARPRHGAVGLPRAARPALLRPRRPGAALPQARAAQERDAGQVSSSATTVDGGAARTARWSTPGPPLDLADALDGGLAERGGTACSPRSSCRWSQCWRRWSRPASRSTPTTSPTWSRHFAGRGEAGGRRGLRGDRAGVQPRLAQAAAGDALRRAGACRRRSAPRPATPPTPTRCSRSREDRAPVPARTCCGTATSPGSGRPSTVCSRPSPTTAGSTPRSTSSSRPPAGSPRTDPNLQNIPIRTEEGRRIRKGVHRRRRLRVAAHRRLQPDRDADHGAPVRGRAAHRRVPPPASDFHSTTAVPGLRRRPPTRSPSRCAPRSRR